MERAKDRNMKLSFDELKRRKEQLEQSEQNGARQLKDVIQEIRTEHCPSHEELGAFLDGNLPLWRTIRIRWHVRKSHCPDCHQVLRFMSPCEASSTIEKSKGAQHF